MVALELAQMDKHGLEISGMKFFKKINRLIASLTYRVGASALNESRSIWYFKMYCPHCDLGVALHYHELKWHRQCGGCQRRMFFEPGCVVVVEEKSGSWLRWMLR